MALFALALRVSKCSKVRSRDILELKGYLVPSNDENPEREKICTCRSELRSMQTEGTSTARVSRVGFPRQRM
jgi:hypothetical protein